MTVETDVTITNNTSGKKFLFRGVAFNPKKSQPVLPFPLINQTPANTFLFRFFGQSEIASFSFGIFNDGTDVSDGTESGGVTTIAQQIQYLNDTIFTADFEDTWTIAFTEVYGSSGITGVIIDLTFDLPKGQPTFRTGTIAIQRGRLIPL